MSNCSYVIRPAAANATCRALTRLPACR